ncbi:MAG: DNA mismatch repair protein MutS [Chloroflexi bacterium]|nr:DNA mismatch repair protein MutS [Chloroflexota bacterium]
MVEWRHRHALSPLPFRACPERSRRGRGTKGVRLTTPIRRQYLSIKRQHPDAILLFRLGDFYETFDEDAQVVARELDIALTSRELGAGQRHPLAGIPYHALDSYLGKLIKKGYKVAICEQTSDPAASRGLVDREVIRVVTPGTVVEPALLEERANNYLASLYVEGDAAGLAYIDVSTSTFASVAQLPLSSLALELERLSPAEVLLPAGQEDQLSPAFPKAPLDPAAFRLDSARQLIMERLGVATLEGYGCEGLPLAIRAAGALFFYLAQNQKEALGRLDGLTTYDLGSTMLLDAQTRRNLELFSAGRGEAKGASLLSVLDFTRTSMGARLLRRWLGQPLLDLAAIHQRQEAVAAFHANPRLRRDAFALLGRIADMERLANRIKSGFALPREVVALGSSLEALPELRRLVESQTVLPRLPACQDAAALIAAAMNPQPGQVGDGMVIKEGFSPDIDNLRLTAQNARDYIARLESKERERTGIRNLKVGYNKVFGYYIEVTTPNLARVPDGYQRRQTITSGERFMTPQLKEYESIVLGARERIEELEASIYRQVCQQIGDEAPHILTAADAVAHLDVFCALAEAAERHSYARPEVNEGLAIEIKDGRHPVVERVLPPGSFVPNDTRLSGKDDQLLLITGPNMAGKSTYIRQVALIVLMAQTGSFVPARSATLGLVDRIFTRVGLQDDLSTGQSTFMVEMVETAAILNSATKRSLIVLDEIGRGTSTYDGLSIAQAVAEHIHNYPRLGCRTLFATHYHELTELAKRLPRVRNYSVAVAEEDGSIAFLHRIVPGGADRSYGVHVAQLAGLPKDIIQRAWELLAEMEGASRDGQPPRARPSAEGNRRAQKAGTMQLGLFQEPSPALQELLALDLNTLTPLEALNKLYELQRKAKGEV